ncbi:MAG: S8 family serine peptidase [Xanthobacteraceae bacterium]
MPKLALTKPMQSGQVPRQLIIRFKRGVVEHVAGTVPASGKRRALTAAMPEEVAGPLDVLKEEVGLKSVRPLFVDKKAAKPPAGAMGLMAVRGALARSATDAPREKLRGFQLVELKGKKPTPALMKRLRGSNAIDLVEPVPNRWLSAKADAFINRQWGLRAISWFDGTHPSAAKVAVAVVDSGVDADHEDLEGVIAEYRHDNNKTRDFLGHGTHVSGIIAAVVNNSVGIAGVANCRLHCWKIFDDPPPGSARQDFNFEFYSSALASALDSDVKVINLSIGGEDHSQAEATIFQELSDAGVVVVAAMGNEFDEGNPKEFPAAYKGVLAVGAVDEVGRRATFSCTGSHIGLVAPGVNILSTVPRQKAVLADATMYDSWPGTSMATPYVAGAAALLYAKRDKSKAAAAAIVKRLKSTATKLPDMKRKATTKEYGSGLLDIAAALKKA